MAETDFDKLPKPKGSILTYKGHSIAEACAPHKEAINAQATPLAQYIFMLMFKIMFFGETDSDELRVFEKAKTKDFQEKTFDRAVAFVSDLCETGGENIRRLNLKLEVKIAYPGFDKLPKPPKSFSQSGDKKKNELGAKILRTYEKHLDPPVKKPFFVCISHMLLDLQVGGYTERSIFETLIKDDPTIDEETFRAAYAFLYDICATGGENIRRLGLKLE